MTIHIFEAHSATEARKKADALGVTSSSPFELLAHVAVLRGALRGARDNIVLHFNPMVIPEDDRARFRTEVELVSKGDIHFADGGSWGDPAMWDQGKMSMDEDAIRARFFTAARSMPPTHEQRAASNAVQDAVIHLATVIEREVSPGRHKERALEDLEAVAMRAIRGIFAESVS